MAQRPDERIRAYHANRHYWQYKSRPLLLLGGSDEDNLFNDARLMQNLESLQACGGNYIRCTLSCRDEGNVWPYAKRDGKYDLTRFNPEFWERLERCCREAYRRDIVVQIEIWATFDYYRDEWLRNPFNPRMNVNYTTADTKLRPQWNHRPASKPQPFFYSPPKLNNDLAVLRFQEAFVQKVLDVTIGYPNVLYCLDNETKAPPQWPWYWAEFIKKQTAQRGVTVQLTEMWDTHDIRNAIHGHTYRRPDLFSYTDVSQNNWISGQAHYDRLFRYRQNLKKEVGGVRPMNNVKVYGLAKGRTDEALNIDRFWQNIFAGCASTRFHRPKHGLGLDDTAQQVIRAARTFTSAFDIFRCEPHPDLLANCEPNEAYCLADPGQTYAVYLPQGGDVILHLDGVPTQLAVQWFDPRIAKFRELQRFSTGPSFRLANPDGNRIWLALIKPK